MQKIERSDVEMFDKVRSQMRQLCTDIEALSKKAPDGPVSKFKLGFINEKLRDANRFAEPPFKPIEGFEQFDDVALPTNSDVVMVLQQYLTCLEKWRSAHVHKVGTRYNSRWVWSIKGDTLGAEAPTSAVHIDEEDDDEDE